MFRPFCAIALFFSVFVVICSVTPLAIASESKPFTGRIATSTPPQPVAAFLIDTDKGQSLTIHDFKGRYVLMNFWATWCAPCVKEMPTLDALSKKLDPKQFQIVAVNENSKGMDVTPNFYAQHNLKNLGVYVDTSGRGLPMVKARALPLTLIIDTQGNEIGRVEGDVNWMAPDVIDYLQKLPAAKATKP